MNRERNSDGDSLVHMAVRGGQSACFEREDTTMSYHLPPSSLSLSLSLTLPPGLSQLPLLYALVSTFKADISLQNSEGLTALCLAAKLGKEKLAEVCLNITRAMTVVVRYRMNLY